MLFLTHTYVKVLANRKAFKYDHTLVNLQLRILFHTLLIKGQKTLLHVH